MLVSPYTLEVEKELLKRKMPQMRYFLKIYFPDREEGREKERERNIDM